MARAIPHLVPVCFVVSEGALYITIDQKPKGDVRALKRLRNITENPVAAFVADRWDEDWTRLGWVMLRGPAEILADGAEHDRAQELLRSRYPQYRGMELAEPPGHRHPHRARDELGQPLRRVDRGVPALSSAAIDIKLPYSRCIVPHSTDRRTWPHRLETLFNLKERSSLQICCRCSGR